MTASILHGGLIALRREGRWAGVLIEGASGLGKSDLALRALEAGYRLVADDRVVVWASGGKLYGRAPKTLAGLIEARGVGVLRTDSLPLCEIVLVVEGVAASEVERTPEPRTTLRAGIALPALALWPLEPTAPAKIRRAVLHLGERP
jgi:serine kinase of HPr protein (carbohydrate metabolism regulator)